MIRENNEQFNIVGANYKQHTPRRKPPSSWQQIKDKPVVSIVVLTIILLGCVFAEYIRNHDPAGFYLANLNQVPDEEFYFGTDSLGRDIFSMIWYGGRVSIIIGLLSMAIMTVIGVIYGCLSGSASAKIDAVMMRVPELVNSIPILLLVLLLTSITGEQNIIKISFVIGVTGWCALARIVRSEVRQIRSSEYVLASRCMGGSFLHVMRKHLIPNFVSTIMFVVVSSISLSMSMESTLSFLGLGLPVDVISWGSMLSLANKALLLNTWWVIIFPGIFLIVTMICITNIAYYFRKEINKRESIL
ncbi:ABC-type dipeptide/oligopeptide/nickel transport system, permease component [uncultured Sporomusa sp.]|uniref:ABC-type dipeptide/oligopeptide/nickel transport system, permease component n=1 Tax=uncultured Sporomusa sp. TaxID=307249 RepID=A0A212M0M6_9FIRM|nr:ABC transporter permease [uncultured Sporomusa sp.]SCM83316.1 ABC-type dipeptide/oligopeptide/nickel transport system, permease component [uncultured Sporomusa sp.]